jgi:hypothetical protein
MKAISENPRAGALEEYAQLKLELASILRAILHIAERLSHELAIQECRRLLARLAEDRFNLAVLGQFSRGKSSLMNALLGAAKLPTGVLPLTSVIITVTYGENERVLLKRDGWTLPQEVRLGQLAEFVTQQGNPAMKSESRWPRFNFQTSSCDLGFTLSTPLGLHRQSPRIRERRASFFPRWTPRSW